MRSYNCAKCGKVYMKCGCVINLFCVGCREYLGKTGTANHICDPKRVAKLEGSRKAHDELGIERAPTDLQRLNDGFAIMNMDEDDFPQNDYLRHQKYCY